jgi:4-amino-4-deoxy-L-arabinose transferase-like glycosyltransferase
MKLTDERLLLLCIVFFAAVYMLAYPQHAFYGDENSYLISGQNILEGRYTHGIFDRAPVLPLMVSACYALGLDVFQVKFILPLFIGIAFILTTFLLGKRFCRRPLIPAIIMLSFPFFWQWCPFLLVDVLLGVFSMLSALYLYKGIEDNRGYLFRSMLFLSLAIMTKVSAIFLIPAFLIYLAYRKRLRLLRDRHFLRGLALFLAILIPAVILTSLSSGTLGLNTRFMEPDYFRIPTHYFLNFALVPWSLLFLYGAYKTLRDRNGKSYVFSILRGCCRARHFKPQQKNRLCPGIRILCCRFYTFHDAPEHGLLCQMG